MTDIYIVRHGNTFDAGEVVTRVGARTDLPLSSSGLAQAEALSAHFQNRLADGFDRAYCSPLQRTRQTAEAILATRTDAPELESLEFLREVDYGPDENQPEDKVIERIGMAALRAWEASAVPPAGWNLDPDHIRGAWKTLIKDLASEALAGPVLVVTSNGIARFVLDAVTRMNAPPASIKLKTGAYGLLRARGDEVELVSWNVRP